MKLLLWILIAFGICQIIVESVIFKRIRDFFKGRITAIHTLLTCYICTGVWIGWILGLFLYSPVQTEFQLSNHWISIFCDGMICSCLVWFIHKIEERI